MPPNITGFSFIRIFAVLSVICVHVADVVGGDVHDYHNINWWVGHTYQSIFRSGIPLFLMLTGALLLPKARVSGFVKSRLLRVAIPFAFWVLVFLIAKNRLVDLTYSAYIKDLVYGNDYTFHLWYVYFIMLVYIVLPLIKHALDLFKPSTNQIFLSIVISGLLIYFIPSTYETITLLIKRIIYLQYVIFGYSLVHAKPEKWLNNLVLAVLLIFAGFLITYLGTFLIEAGYILDLGSLYDSAMLHIFLKSLGIWIILQRFASNSSIRYKGLIRKLSDFSFGIYLIHPLVWEHILISRMDLTVRNLNTILGVGIISVLCYGVGALIIYLLSKIPLGKFLY